MNVIPTPKTTNAIADSRTTKNFITKSDAKTILMNNAAPNNTNESLRAKLPDGRLLTTNGQVNLNIKNLPHQAN